MLALCVVLGLFDTLGDPRSFSATSTGGRFVLVMQSPASLEAELEGVGPAQAARLTALRAYPSSGLYPVGSVTPIWTINRFEGAVLVPSDGKHLVAYDPLVTDPSTPFLRFYREGKVVRSYRLRDLVIASPLCPTSVSGALACIEDNELADDVVVVHPRRGLALEFDLDGSFRWFTRGLLLVSVCFLLALGGFAWILRRARSWRRSKAESP